MSFRGKLSPYKPNNWWNMINLYPFSTNFPYFSSYVTVYCNEICLPTAYFTSSRCVLKCGFPKFGLFFSKRPAGFHCCKRPSPTFANIWSHCPWALQSAAPVVPSSKCIYFTFSRLRTTIVDSVYMVPVWIKVSYNKMHSERAKRSTPCDQSLKWQKVL